MSAALRIDIVSDTVCPWCYVGKRHLEAALAQRPDVAVSCHWQPFQLNPDMPMDGVDRKTHWKQKFGDESRIAGMTQQLKEVGQTLGIPFDFDAISRQPNTLPGHALLHHLDGRWTQQNELKEQILKGFFVDGKDIGDTDTLQELAAAVGMDGDEAKTVLADEHHLERVRLLDQQAREMGISGVPTFIFDRRTALVGAQPVAALVKMIDELRPETAVH